MHCGSIWVLAARTWSPRRSGRTLQQQLASLANPTSHQVEFRRRGFAGGIEPPTVPGVTEYIGNCSVSNQTYKDSYLYRAASGGVPVAGTAASSISPPLRGCDKGPTRTPGQRTLRLYLPQGISGVLASLAGGSSKLRRSILARA